MECHIISSRSTNINVFFLILYEHMNQFSIYVYYTELIKLPCLVLSFISLYAISNIKKKAFCENLTSAPSLTGLMGGLFLQILAREFNFWSTFLVNWGK